MTLPALALLVLGSSVASAHGGKDFFAGLTEEQRSALEEARELRKEGDLESAREVLKGAGFDPEMRRPHMLAKTEEERTEMQKRHEAILSAIEENDFEAFQDAVADAPFATLVTEENFAKLVEAHKLLEAGDKEGARALFEDMGYGPRHHGWFKNKGGNGNSTQE